MKKKFNNTRQPYGLYILSLAELWDRFGYYGIQSILILYLTGVYHLSDPHAYVLFGIFTTLAFCTPVIGGLIADRLTGYAPIIRCGFVLLIAGNLVLLTSYPQSLFIGLSLFIWGIGFFKSNNASLLATLYQPSDMRKESGFTIYYMGMNAGAILGPLVFGMLAAVNYGWHVGFLVNALGFSAAFALFLATHGYFKKNSSVYRQQQHGNSHTKNSLITILLYGASVGIVIFTTLLFNHPLFFQNLIVIVMVFTCLAILGLAYKQPPVYRRHIMLLFILFLFAVFYFACSLQLGSSLTLFIDREIDRHVLGWQIPTAAFSALEPTLIILSTPLLVPIWLYLEKKHQAPSLIIQAVCGLLFGAISLFIFALAARATFWHGINLPLLAIVGGNFFLGLGELCLCPALIAAPSQLLPLNLQSTFIGLYFLFTAFSAYAASLLAKLTVAPLSQGISDQLVYFRGFSQMALIALAGFILLLLLAPWLQQLIDLPGVVAQNPENH